MDDKKELPAKSGEVCGEFVALLTMWPDDWNQAIMDGLPVGVALFSPDQRAEVLRCNRQMEELFGGTCQGAGFAGRVTDESLLCVRTCFRRLLAARGERIGETAVQRSSNQDGGGWFRIYMKLTETSGKERAILAVCVEISREKRCEERLARLLERDEKAGVLNRETFCQKAEALLRKNRGERYVLALWNIKRFQLVNDLLGVAVGNQIIRCMGETLDKLIPSGGLCGYLNADHFAVCLPERLFFVERFLARLDACLKSLNLAMTVECDAGIYVITEPDAPVSLMCDWAAMALQEVKGDCSRRYAYYHAEMRRRALTEQCSLESILDALEKGQFLIYFQPIADVESGELVYAEALARWVHPQRGVVLPDEFIPILEKNGLVTRLDHEIWEQGCRYLRKRLDKGLSVIPLSMNISRRCLQGPKLCADIIGLAEKYRLPRNLLKYEITETAYMDAPQRIAECVKELQAQGFQILMDDFGSGFSSLNLLKDLPVDILKVDMCFLQGVGQSWRAGMILTSVIRMAKRLGLPVVVEGVETQEHVDFLKSVGGDLMQGYYLSRPIPAEAFDRLMERPRLLGKGRPVWPAINAPALFKENSEVGFALNCVACGFAVFESVDHRLELLWANRPYYQALEGGGAGGQHFDDALEYVAEEDRLRAREACERALSEGRADCMVRYVRRGRCNRRVKAMINRAEGRGNERVLCVTFWQLAQEG